MKKLILTFLAFLMMLSPLKIFGGDIFEYFKNDQYASLNFMIEYESTPKLNDAQFEQIYTLLKQKNSYIKMAYLARFSDRVIHKMYENIYGINASYYNLPNLILELTTVPEGSAEQKYLYEMIYNMMGETLLSGIVHHLPDSNDLPLSFIFNQKIFQHYREMFNAYPKLLHTTYNNDHRSLLSFAIKNKNDEMISYLIYSGSSPKFMREDVLSYAIKNHNVKLALACINIINCPMGGNYYNASVFYSMPEIRQELLRKNLLGSYELTDYDYALSKEIFEKNYYTYGAARDCAAMNGVLQVYIDCLESTLPQVLNEQKPLAVDTRTEYEAKAAHLFVLGLNRYGGANKVERAVYQSYLNDLINWLKVNPILDDSLDFRGNNFLHILAAQGNHEFIKLLKQHQKELKIDFKKIKETKNLATMKPIDYAEKAMREGPPSLESKMKRTMELLD